MGTLWFWIVAVMLAAYVILDGFDLGVGIVYLWVAKTEQERQLSLRAIGPVWDGNEVWLLAAGVRCSSPFRCCTHRPSAASICR
jgi:cytochrome bd ubiquinol oxidase subunit II